jgi:feruloyl esterase
LCACGQGSGKLGALTAVVGWVTKDQAPDSLLPTAVDSSEKTTASRPASLFPYVAENTTGGPADEASSYTPVLSAVEANLTLPWLSSFRSGDERVGNWVHGKWVVSKGKA